MVHLYAAIPPVYFDRDFRQSPHIAVLYFHDNRFVVQHLLALQELLSPRVRGLVPRLDLALRHLSCSVPMFPSRC